MRLTSACEAASAIAKAANADLTFQLETEKSRNDDLLRQLGIFRTNSSTKIQELYNEISKLQQKLLEEILKKSDKTVTTKITTEISGLEKQLKEAFEAKNKVDSECTAATLASEKVISELRIQLQKQTLRAELAERLLKLNEETTQAAIDKLLLQIAELGKRKTELVSSSDPERDLKILQLELELAALQRMLDRKIKEKADLDNKCKGVEDASKAALEALQAAFDAEKKRATEAEAAAKEAAATIAATLASSEANLSSCKAALEAAKSTGGANAALESEVKTLTDRVKSLEAELSKSKSECAAAAAKSESLYSECKVNLTKQTELAEIRIKELTLINNSLKLTIEKLDEEKKSLEAKLLTKLSAEEREQITRQIQIIKNILEIKTAEKSSLDSKCEEAAKKLRETIETLKIELSEEKDKTSKVMLELTITKESLNFSITELETQLAGYKSTLASLISSNPKNPEIEKLKLQIKLLPIEIERKRKEIEVITRQTSLKVQECETAKLAIISLEQQCNENYKTVIAEKDKLYLELQLIYASLELKIEDLQKKLEEAKIKQKSLESILPKDISAINNIIIEVKAIQKLLDIRVIEKRVLDTKSAEANSKCEEAKLQLQIQLKAEKERAFSNLTSLQSILDLYKGELNGLYKQLNSKEEELYNLRISNVPDDDKRVKDLIESIKKLRLDISKKTVEESGVDTKCKEARELAERVRDENKRLHELELARANALDLQLKEQQAKYQTDITNLYAEYIKYINEQNEEEPVKNDGTNKSKSVDPAINVNLGTSSVSSTVTNTGMEDKLEQLRKQLNAIKGKKNSLDRSSSKLNQRIKELEAENAQERQNYSAALDLLKQYQGPSSVDLSESIKSLNAKKEELEKLKQEDRSEAEIKKAQDEFNKESSLHNQKLQKEKDERFRYQNENARLQTELTQSQLTISQHTKALETLQSANALEIKRIQELLDKCSQTSQLLKKLPTQEAALSSQGELVGNLQADISSLKASNQIISSQLESLKTKSAVDEETYKKRVKELSERVAAAEELQAACRLELTTKQQAYDALDFEKKAADAKAARTQKDLDEFVEKTTKNDLTEALKKQFDEATKRAEKAEADRLLLLTESDQWHKKYDIAEAAIKPIQDQLADYMRQLEEANKKSSSISWITQEFKGDKGKTASLTDEEITNFMKKLIEDAKRANQYLENPQNILEIKSKLPEISSVPITTSAQKKVGGYKYSKRGGGVEDDQLLYYKSVSLFDLPNKWMEQHNNLYRDPTLLKLLSLNPTKISQIPLDPIDKQKIILSIFIDISLLKEYYEYLFKNYQNGNLYQITKENYENLIKKISVYKELIKPITSFGDNVNFVLIEDLINFFKKWTDTYITSKKDTFNYITDTKLLVCMIELYKHWEYYNENILTGLIAKLHTQDVLNKIETLYNEETAEPIRTYLRVRCDTKPIYNQYFNLYTEPISNNKTRLQSLYIAGPDTNLQIPFYNDKSTTALPQGVTNIILNSDKTLKKITNYDYGYLYGPLTRIFDQNTTNAEISNNTGEIIDALKKDKPVFIIGYGASGSGKTSTLIEYKGPTTTENGVILEILKKLDISALKVSIYELYSDEEPKINQKTGKIITNNKKHEYLDIEFEKEGDNFIIKKTLNKNRFKDPNPVVVKNGEKWEKVEYSWEISNGEFKHSLNNNQPIKKLGTFITSLIDTPIRMVNPTPNNQQSSRSHVLAFLEMTIKVDDKDKQATLICGDLAGVENKFDCKDPKTKVDFIKLTLPETKNNPDPEPYYITKGSKYVEIVASGNEVQKPLEEKILKYFKYTSIKDVGEYKTDKGGLPVIGFNEYLNYLEDSKKNIDTLNRMYDLYKTNSTAFNNTASEVESKITELIDSGKDQVIRNIERSNESEEDKKLMINLLNSTIKKIDYDPIELPKFPIDNSWVSKTCQCNIEPARTSVKINGKPEAGNKGILSDCVNKTPYLNEYYIDLYNEINGKNYNNEYYTNKAITKYGLITLNDTLITSFNGIIPILNMKVISGHSVDFENKTFNKHNINLYTTSKAKINALETKIARYSGSLSTYMADRNLLSNPAMTQNIIIKYNILELLGKIGIPNEYSINNINDKNINEYVQRIPEEGVMQLFKNSVDRIYKQLKLNINLYYTQIEARCEERTAEGIFINKSLYGMRKDIINIVNNNQRDALLQKLPLFKSDCLKYYCSKDTYDCFNLVKHLPEGVKEDYTKDIMETISKRINNDEIMKKLSIVVFGVINISTNVNDPPKMPYINLNNIKIIREKFIMYIKLKESITYKKLEQVDKKKKDDEYQKLLTEINTFKASTLVILNKFEKALGSSIIKSFEEKYRNFTSENSDLKEKYNLFMILIDNLEEINSTSILGTIDFLEEMKNTLHTDNTCSIKAIGDQQASQNLQLYKNIVTNKTLAQDIAEQTIISATGGSRISYEKQQLIKEYKKLMKQYKK